MTQWEKSLSSNNYSIKQYTHDDLRKSKYKPQTPAVSSRGTLWDPLAIQSAMGFKDRTYSLSYDVLKRIPEQLSVIAAIIQTRVYQISSFAAPFRLTKSLGFEVKHKDPAHYVTDSEREMIASIEQFIYNCGHPDENPHNEHMVRRDDFETFLKKVVRDSLMYDQLCFEIVPNRKGEPYEFMAVDASTMRYAAVLNADEKTNWMERNGMAQEQNSSSPYRIPNNNNTQMPRSKNFRPAYVMVIDGQPVEAFSRDEMAFGIRNPRTDLTIQGYGLSELELLISTITAHLYAEEYNRRFFMQGSSPKGILNFKGDEMTPDMLEGFRRQWRDNVQGVENSWKTPIMQSEGVEWIDLHKTNSDMEYNQWMEYLIKVSCAVFQIDPAEINFDLAGGVSQTPLFESSSEWKLKASRDKGLKPLLRFIAKLINDYIVSKIDDRFTFDFVGLDELSEQEKHELRMEQLQSYMTLNEIRAAEDLPPLPHGDMPMNPTYIQAKQAALQEEQQKQAMEAQAPANAASGGAGQGASGGAEEEPEEDKSPAYSDRFTKSLLEVQFDDDEDWITILRG